MLKGSVGTFASDISGFFTETLPEFIDTDVGGFLGDIGEKVGTDISDAYDYVRTDQSFFDEYGYFRSDVDPTSSGFKSSLMSDLSEGIGKSREWYSEFKETGLGKAVDKGAQTFAKGALQQAPVRAQRPQLPGALSAGTFRSSAVNLQPGFSDARIADAMYRALNSDVPSIRLSLQTVSPTLRGGGTTVSTGSATVSAPKIRKLSSKSAKATS